MKEKAAKKLIVLELLFLAVILPLVCTAIIMIVTKGK